MTELIFNCPHCNDTIIVQRNETNCCIFRHGVMKEDFQQINPHLPKESCDQLKEQDKIYGCGKPFRLVPDRNFEAEVCDYV